MRASVPFKKTMMPRAVARDAGIRCGLIGVTNDGRIQWMAGEGAALLAAYWPAWNTGEETVPRLVRTWIHRELTRRLTDSLGPMTGLILNGPGRQLHLRMIHEHQRLFLWLEERSSAGPQTESTDPGLTARERQVLEWLAQGKTNPEIGLILGISSRTVQKHAERLYRKLGVETRLAAAMCLMERGSLVRPAC
jgi:DNA-binding CsgD family transcriptional regulator